MGKGERERQRGKGEREKSCLPPQLSTCIFDIQVYLVFGVSALMAQAQLSKTFGNECFLLDELGCDELLGCGDCCRVLCDR